MKQGTPTFDERVSRARRQVVMAQGPRAAAWLIWIARAKLRSSGAVNYHFRPGEREPKYFLVAVALLRTRPRKWRVKKAAGEDGGSDYRVTWLLWRTSGARHAAERAARVADDRRRARNARKRANARWFR